MKRLIFIFYFLIIAVISTAQKTAPESISVREFSIGKEISFYSEILQEERILNIYLPQGFNSGDSEKYPVIYLLDGSADEDFIHIAGLVQFASFPWVKYLPETIVVGIANKNRMRDLTFPTQVEADQQEYPMSGKSADFIDFLNREVQPLIETSFPVNQTKILIGQSLGGLLATEVLLHHPELFSHYIIVSPSLWWNEFSIVQDTPSATSQKKVFLAVGNESEKMVEPARELAEKLQQSHQVTFEYFGDQDHGNILHLAVYRAFEKMHKIQEMK